jgi:magnesium chelatase family protein
MTKKRYSLCSVWTTCYSAGELKPIEVQVLVRSGLPKFDIIGLPQNVIREGKDRILSALCHLGVELPTQKVLVSLNPGDVQKEGSHFDLPILAGLLGALGLIKKPPPNSFFWGELRLDGSVRPTDDLLAHLFFAQSHSASQTVMGGDSEKYSFIKPFLMPQPTFIQDCSELKNSFEKEDAIPQELKSDFSEEILNSWVNQKVQNSLWNSLRGSDDQFLFWSLVALGRHNVLIEGPPGVGKSTWCYALKELQAPLHHKLWNEKFRYNPGISTNIKSLGQLVRPTYLAPHHSSSKASIIGGGNASISTGAITRAHRGILFLDEFNEYSRDVLESLREPLETKTLSIARRGAMKKLEANIHLLAAMNPCKCGNFRSKKLCDCLQSQLNHFKAKISGPLKDRFHAIPFWVFQDEPQSKQFELSNVRKQIIQSRNSPRPLMNKITLPQNLSPRRKKRWIEFFESWCRWFGVAEANQADAAEFNHFIKRMETQDDDFNTAEI